MGFLKGAALGAILVVPLVAVAVWCTAQLGIGNSSVTMAQDIRMAAIFAGIASVLTAGGIGRLAAHASTLPGGRRTAIWRASRTQAIASGGLAIIAAIPHGQLPEHPVKWLWIVAAGMVSGAIAGSVIGFVCGTPTRPRAPTVKDILRAIPELAKTGASGTSIPAQRPVTERPKSEPEPRSVAPSVGGTAEPVAVTEAVAEPVAVTEPVAKPEPVAAPTAAKPKKRTRRKPPVKDPPKTEPPAPEPGSRAALLVTPPPAVTRLATPSPTQIDTSVATEPSSPTTDGGATPLPKPVPLGEDITGVEDEPAKPVLPLPAEPSIPHGAPLLTPEPAPPNASPGFAGARSTASAVRSTIVKKVLERVEHTDVPTDVRNTDVPTDVHTTDVPTDVRTDVTTDVHEPADPTEPRGKP